MKYAMATILALLFSAAVQAESMCQVRVCNKLERFSLSISSHVKDYLGKTCFDIELPQSQAVPGKELDSKSKWYQGSFNPTKKSVTRVDSVGACHG